MSTATESIAVTMRGVTKSFGSGESLTLALREVELRALFGELMMIVGPSGCGKTTLLSVVCGTLKADSGEIEVLGHALHKMKDREITEFRRTNVGFVFQQFNLIPTLSAVENVSVPLLLSGMRPREAEDGAARMLCEVGLENRLHHRPAQLSGGQQQRVAIARALVHDPALLICDEPTAALDAASGQKVMELLRKVACRADRCVLVVTHDNRIFGFADRIAEVEDGSVKCVREAREGANHA